MEHDARARAFEQAADVRATRPRRSQDSVRDTVGPPAAELNRAYHPDTPKPDLHVSDGIDGEEQAQRYIRHFMLNILKPVGDHVRDLHSQVAELRFGLQAQAERIGHNDGVIDQALQEVNTVRVNAAKMNARLDTAFIEIHVATEERARLTTEQTVLAERTSKLKVRQESTQASVQTLKLDVQNLEHDTRSLSEQCLTSSKLIGEHGVKLESLDVKIEELNASHDATNKELIKVGQSLEENRRSIGLNLSKIEALKQDTADGFARLDKANDGVLKRTQELQVILDGHQKEIQENHARIYELQQALEVAGLSSAAIEGLNARQQEIKTGLEQTIENLGRVDECVDRLGAALTGDRHDNAEVHTDLQARITANASNIDLVTASQLVHAEKLAQAAKTITEMLANEDKLAKQIEAELREIQALIVWRQSAQTEIELHSVQNYQAQFEIRQLNEELSSTMHNLKELQGNLVGANGAIASLNLRFEACSKNIQGMGRGFQDTFKHVLAGDAGMLAPKSNQVMALPPVKGSLGTYYSDTPGSRDLQVSPRLSLGEASTLGLGHEPPRLPRARTTSLKKTLESGSGPRGSLTARPSTVAGMAGTGTGPDLGMAAPHSARPQSVSGTGGTPPYEH